MQALSPRSTELGGFTIRRLLPQRPRRMVGAWCFLDVLGPVAVGGEQSLDVPPHPHIGLQTVTWVLAGEALHEDSLGSEAVARPGTLNLMTSGGNRALRGNAARQRRAPAPAPALDRAAGRRPASRPVPSPPTR